MASFVALLRGINVGGKHVPMKILASIFSDLGYRNVQTVLNSGNVIFESSPKETTHLVKEIEKAIENKFHFTVLVQVREMAEINNIVRDNPFASETPSKDFRWYATFLNKPPAQLPEGIKGGFRFITFKHGALFSILNRQSAKSTDFMTYLDKNFGKDVTTRNWNTVMKIQSKMQEMA